MINKLMKNKITHSISFNINNEKFVVYKSEIDFIENALNTVKYTNGESSNEYFTLLQVLRLYKALMK